MKVIHPVSQPALPETDGFGTRSRSRQQQLIGRLRESRRSDLALKTGNRQRGKNGEHTERDHELDERQTTVNAYGIGMDRHGDGPLTISV